MSKYYKVFLEYGAFCTICKKMPFTKNIYQEIITGKIIYPKNKYTSDKLTYGNSGEMAWCHETTNREVQEWLCKLDTEEYVSDLERIEDILAKSHKVEMDEKIVYRSVEKEAGKSIKRRLREIKQK